MNIPSWSSDCAGRLEALLRSCSNVASVCATPGANGRFYASTKPFVSILALWLLVASLFDSTHSAAACFVSSCRTPTPPRRTLYARADEPRTRLPETSGKFFRLVGQKHASRHSTHGGQYRLSRHAELAYSSITCIDETAVRRSDEWKAFVPDEHWGVQKCRKTQSRLETFLLGFSSLDLRHAARSYLPHQVTRPTNLLQNLYNHSSSARQLTRNSQKIWRIVAFISPYRS